MCVCVCVCVCVCAVPSVAVDVSPLSMTLSSIDSYTIVAMAVFFAKLFLLCRVAHKITVFSNACLIIQSDGVWTLNNLL